MGKEIQAYGMISGKIKKDGSEVSDEDVLDALPSFERRIGEQTNVQIENGIVPGEIRRAELAENDDGVLCILMTIWVPSLQEPM